MEKHTALFLTHRGAFHQQNILSAAPESLQITMLRDADHAQIIERLPEVEFLITEREQNIDAEMITAGKQLRLIQRLGRQTWDIDLDTARHCNIPVCFWPDQSCVNVAEHMLMVSLELLKQSRQMSRTINSADWANTPQRCDEDTFAYNWTGRTGVDTLRGKTVGILGFGEIGRELAVMLRGFDCRVFYNKRSPMPKAAEMELSINYADWDDLVSQSDVIHCLLPYIPQQQQSINKAFFDRMKNGSYFIFAGGSGMVDESALIDSLEAGHLVGAGLDTFTYEPLPTGSPLIKIHRDTPINLILTPHVAAGTRAGDRKEEYTNIQRLLNSQELLYRVV